MSPLTTVRLIAWREVRQRLRSRLFVGTTIGLSIVLALLALTPVLSGLVGESTDAPDDAGRAPVVVAVVGELTEVELAALDHVVGGVLDVRPTTDEPAAARLVADGDAAFAVIDADQVLEPPPDGVFVVGPDLAARAAEALAVADVLGEVGLEPPEVGRVLEAPPLAIEVAGDFDAGAHVGSLVLANVGVLFLFTVLALYSTLIVNGIIEEKGSRVIELLVETVRVRHLMTGKLLGLGAVGLGQTFVLFVPAVLVLAATGSAALPAASGTALLFVVMWFLLGYAFYSVVAAALGSLVSRPEEAQAVLTPASVLMAAGFLVGFFAINAPDGAFAVVAGWFPPTAPYVMLVRQLLGAPSVIEVMGAVGLTVLATMGVAAVATRIYEGSILRTGARVRLRDAWRSSEIERDVTDHRTGAGGARVQR